MDPIAYAKALLADSPAGQIYENLKSYPSPMAAIYSNADRLKRRLVDALTNPVANAERTAGQIKDNPQQFSNNVMGMAPMAIGATVWHGSPHKFDKFDMSKIGTGEGAQAYGHGLYMAEAPDVAKSYQQINWHNIAKNGGNVELNGMPVEFNTYGNAVGDIDKSGKQFLQRVAQTQDVQKAIEATKQSIEEMRGLAKSGFAGADSIVADLKGQLDFAAKHNIRPTGQAGALYKVDIPDEAVSRFLDWDKPLSQQAPEVQAALHKFNGEYGEFYPMLGESLSPLEQNATTGRTIYNIIGGDNVAGGSRDLKSIGIPGIRYLDGGSRGAGNGTSNFVLFDDQMPRILEINGTPTGNQPWKPGEWSPKVLGDALANTK